MVTDKDRAQLDGAASMDRRELIESIMRVDCGFPVDFTPEYLSTLSETKLRHVYIALCRSAEKPAPWSTRRPQDSPPAP